jgi:hypothetical protein
MSWWPWAQDDEPAPERQPYLRPSERVELTPAGERVVWQARVDQADAVIAEALRAHSRGMVTVDVLLDIRLALHPVALRPPVPVMPGPDGACHA